MCDTGKNNVFKPLEKKSFFYIYFVKKRSGLHLFLKIKKLGNQKLNVTQKSTILFEKKYSCNFGKVKRYGCKMAFLDVFLTN